MFISKKKFNEMLKTISELDKQLFLLKHPHGEILFRKTGFSWAEREGKYNYVIAYKNYDTNGVLSTTTCGMINFIAGHKFPKIYTSVANNVVFVKVNSTENMFSFDKKTGTVGFIFESLRKTLDECLVWEENTNWRFV